MGCSTDPAGRRYLRPAQGFDRSKGSRRRRSCRPALPRNLAVAHEPTGLLAMRMHGGLGNRKIRSCDATQPAPNVCLSTLHRDALVGVGTTAIAGSWTSTCSMPRNVEVRWGPGEETSAGLAAVPLGVLSPSARRCLGGLPGWPGAPVMHRAPM